MHDVTPQRSTEAETSFPTQLSTQCRQHHPKPAFRSRLNTFAHTKHRCNGGKQAHTAGKSDDIVW